MSKKKQEAAADAPPKKKRLGRLLLFLAAAMVLGGGGLGAGLWASGLIGGHGDEDPNQPHLVPRDDASAEEVAAATERARAGHVDAHVFKPTYYALATPFTSNLRGGDAFVQIGLGVSTFYDERVIDRVKEHEMAVRSAILLTLSEQDPMALTTAEGKERLRQALKNAVNNVLTSKEGFGGIDEVYFTSFVTQ